MQTLIALGLFFFSSSLGLKPSFFKLFCFFRSIFYFFRRNFFFLCPTDTRDNTFFFSSFDSTIFFRQFSSCSVCKNINFSYFGQDKHTHAHISFFFFFVHILFIIISHRKLLKIYKTRFSRIAVNAFWVS